MDPDDDLEKCMSCSLQFDTAGSGGGWLKQLGWAGLSPKSVCCFELRIVGGIASGRHCHEILCRSCWRLGLAPKNS